MAAADHAPPQSGRYESYDAGASLATGSGWIDHRHAINVFVGMDATMSLNVNGVIYDLPAVVVDIYADREPEGRAKSGYIVDLIANTESIPPGAGLTVPDQQGGPADIRVHAPLFDPLPLPSDADALAAALTGSHVPGLEATYVP